MPFLALHTETLVDELTAHPLTCVLVALMAAEEAVVSWAANSLFEVQLKHFHVSSAVMGETQGYQEIAVPSEAMADLVA